MLKVLPLILAMVAMTAASASEMGAKIQPVNPSGKVRDQEKSFNIFFGAEQSSLTPEGREIISEAAKQFTDSHSSNAHMYVIRTAGENLAGRRADAVKEQLERDGIKPEVINAERDLRPAPATLQEWQNRRVSIAIRTNPRLAKVAN